MNRYLAGTALSLGAILGASAATAEAGAPSDEIVVTAQRRQQSAQDVGIALSVVGGEDLVRRGVTSVNDLQQAVANLEVEPAFGGGQPQFRIRGVGFQDYASNNAPTVGIYVNEVAYPVPIMTQGLIFDVARVEVLRGPQGTLYGRNTTGGAINVITNRPTDTIAAGGFVELGRFDAVRGEAYLSGPLGQGLSLRVAGATEQGGAFQRNRATGESLGDQRRIGGRSLLRYEDGAFTALLDAHAGVDRGETVGLTLLDPLQTSLRPGVAGALIPADASRRLTGWGLSPNLARDAALPSAKPGRRNWSLGGSLTLGIDLGAVRLTSITAADKLRRREYGDYDASASIEADVFFGSRVGVVSQEVRLASDGAGPLTWVAGVYYARQTLHERYFSDFLNLFATYARVTYDQTVESISGFGQVEYRLAPRLTLIGGLRYEEETRRLNGFGSAFGGAQALPPTNVRTRMTPVIGKIGAEFRPVERLLLYASASKGVKSGGFTTYNTGDASGIQPFAPETLYAYEIGIKAVPSRAIQLSGAAYYYDYRDQQVLDAVCGVNGPIGRFANARKSEIYGVEGEVRLRPAAGLTIAPYASYKHGAYKDFGALNLAACRAIPRQTLFTDLAGTRIPFPKVELGGSVAQDVRLGRFVVTPSSTFSYRSTGFSWLGARYDIPAYWLVNADLTIAPGDGRWSAAIWGRNILNADYDLTRNFFTSANVAQPGRPATYGVRFGVRY